MSGHHKTAPLTWAGTVEEHIRLVALTVNDIMKGVTNNTKDVTLRGTPEVTTEVTLEAARVSQMGILVPRNAAAAADLAGGATWASVTKGKVTIHHAAGSSDREYGVIVQG